MKNIERLPDLAVPVTPELENQIAQFHRDAAALHLPTLPVVYVNTKVTDKEGNVLEDRKYKANSFNRNFLNILALMFCPTVLDDTTFGNGLLSLKDIGGPVKTFDANIPLHSFACSGGVYYTFPGFKANYADDGWGILAGSGNSIESFEDYKLDNKISHGVGLGQLSYGECNIANSGKAVWDNTAKTMTNNISRVFINNGSADVNVNECGIATSTYYASVFATVMLERTLFAATKVIPPAGQLVVTYTFSLTFPV
jgi:hypothetical protein